MNAVKTIKNTIDANDYNIVNGELWAVGEHLWKLDNDTWTVVEEGLPLEGRELIPTPGGATTLAIYDGDEGLLTYADGSLDEHEMPFNGGILWDPNSKLLLGFSHGEYTAFHNDDWPAMGPIYDFHLFQRLQWTYFDTQLNKLVMAVGRYDGPSVVRMLNGHHWEIIDLPTHGQPINLGGHLHFYAVDDGVLKIYDINDKAIADVTTLPEDDDDLELCFDNDAQQLHVIGSNEHQVFDLSGVTPTPMTYPEYTQLPPLDVDANAALHVYPDSVDEDEIEELRESIEKVVKAKLTGLGEMSHRRNPLPMRFDDQGELIEDSWMEDAFSEGALDDQFYVLAVMAREIEYIGDDEAEHYFFREDAFVVDLGLPGQPVASIGESGYVRLADNLEEFIKQIHAFSMEDFKLGYKDDPFAFAFGGPIFED